jgi:hypothetical protein
MLISSLDVLIGLLLGCLSLSCMDWIGFPCTADLFFMWAGLVFHLLLISFLHALVFLCICFYVFYWASSGATRLLACFAPKVLWAFTRVHE